MAQRPPHGRYGNGANTGSSRTEGEKPWDLVLLAGAALILISVGRVHSFIPGIEAVRPGVIVVAVGLLALLFRHAGARAPKYLKTTYGYIMAFVFLWAIMGLPFSIYPGNSVRFLLESFLRTAIVVVVIASSVRTAQDLERLLRVFAIGAIVFSIGATGTEGFRDIRAGGYDPNDSAMFIVAAIPLILHFLIRSPSLLTRAFYGLGLMACGSAVVLSGSRGGFLALAAVLGFCLVFYRSVTPAVRVAVVAGVLAVVSVQATGEFWERMETITDQDDYNRHSITGRFELWSRGMGYVAASPIFGVGINNFPVAEGRHPVIAERIRRGIGTRYSAPHSVWVQASSELGIPGFLGLAALFGYGMRLLWRHGRRRARRGIPPDVARLKDLALPMIGVLVGLAVAGTFLSHAYSGLLWGTFALVLAFTKVLAMQSAGSTARPEPTPRPSGHRTPVGSGWNGPRNSDPGPIGPPSGGPRRPAPPPIAPPPALRRQAASPPPSSA